MSRRRGPRVRARRERRPAQGQDARRKQGEGSGRAGVGLPNCGGQTDARDLREHLVVTHHYFFRHEGRTLPARAMEDIFEQIEKDSGIQTRWIAVNTPPMSVNHEAKSVFEKKAAEEIAAGKAAYDRVEDGYYRRASAIPLGAGWHGLAATPLWWADDIRALVPRVRRRG